MDYDGGQSGPGFNEVFGRWYRRVEVAGRQPRWVVRTAVAAAVLVVVVPLALLTLAAVAVGAVCFIVLALVANVVGAIRGGLSRWDDVRYGSGRTNVRVIRRD